jgi:hypothetical protein
MYVKTQSDHGGHATHRQHAPATWRQRRQVPILLQARGEGTGHKGKDSI